MPVQTKAPSQKHKSKANIPMPSSGTRRLVRWYLITLGLLAVLSVTGQIVMQCAMQASEIDASPALHKIDASRALHKEAGGKYGQESAGHLTLLREMQGGFCVLTVFVLGGLAILSGRGGVSRTIAALYEMEEKTAELDTALGRADQRIEEMQETLANLSAIDALTGLKNHRAFQEQLDREMSRALRHGHPLSLLLLDIDRFKSYNDSFSHTEGDEALKLVSEMLKETARTSDIPARYGGEEFAIILTETDMMGAVVLGERLRQAIASSDGLQRPLTASIGIATLTPSIFSVAALVAQADRALCHAKGDGRNRVSHAHRLPAPLEDEAPVYARAA